MFILIKDLDALTTREEVMNALVRKLGPETEVIFKSLKPAYGLRLQRSRSHTL